MFKSFNNNKRLTCSSYRYHIIKLLTCHVVMFIVSLSLKYDYEICHLSKSHSEIYVVNDRQTQFLNLEYATNKMLKNHYAVYYHICFHSFIVFL